LYADVCVPNPTNWDQLIATKAGTTNEYIFASPQFATRPLLWGLRTIITNSIAADSFLVLDSTRAAMVWNRQSVTVEVSREHSDYFTRNMAAVLAEARLALTIFHSGAIIYGSFPFGS
jgi:HK97 family phage major capsid protein